MKAPNQTVHSAYRVVYRRVKNINLHVANNGEVWVSAPHTASHAMIDKFVHSKSDWIMRTQNHMAQQANHTFFDGSTVLLLGERVPVTIQRANKSRAAYQDGLVTLAMPAPDDHTACIQMLDGWLSSYSGQVFARMQDAAFAPFAQMGVAKPVLRPRRMKARWGSCHVQKGLILLSHRLVCTPPHCIHYVLAHEFAHLVHPNHSTAFYSLLDTVLPDHKAVRLQLKEYAGVMR